MNQQQTSGVSFLGLLVLLLIGLKLTEFITLSWLVILIPFWVPLLILIIFYIVVILWK